MPEDYKKEAFLHHSAHSGCSRAYVHLRADADCRPQQGQVQFGLEAGDSAADHGQSEFTRQRPDTRRMEVIPENICPAAAILSGS
ncbi:hypothetical protein D3C81_1874000 [compost metagenome]